MKRFITVLVVFVVFAFVSGCSKEEGAVTGSKGAEKAAVVQGGPLVSYVNTAGEAFEWNEEEIGEHVPSATNAKDYSGFKSRIINALFQEAYFKEAMKQGLASDSDVLKAAAKLKYKMLSRIYLEKEVADNIEITEEEYGEVIETTPTTVSHLIILAPKNFDDIPKIEEEIKAGEDFQKLINKYGSENTIKKRGDFGWVVYENAVIPDVYKDLVFTTPSETVIKEPVNTLLGPVFIYVKEAISKEEDWARMKEKVDPDIRRTKFQKIIPEIEQELRKEFDVKILVDFNRYGESLAENNGIVATIGDIKLVEEKNPHGEWKDPETLRDKQIQQDKFNKRLNEMVIAMKAEQLGYDKDGEYLEKLEEVTKKALWSSYKRYIYTRPFDITEADLKDYYAKAKEMFKKVPTVDLFKFYPVDEDKLTEVEMAVSKVESQAEAEALAKEMKIEFSLHEGLPLANMSAEMREAQEGVPYRGTLNFLLDDNYAVYQVWNRQTEEYIPDFDEVRDQVETKYKMYMQAQNLNNFVSDEMAKIKLNEEKLRAFWDNAPKIFPGKGTPKGH